jgi:hypothetical protein
MGMTVLAIFALMHRRLKAKFHHLKFPGEVEEINRELDQRFFSYELVSIELRRLFDGLQVEPGCPLCSENPTSRLEESLCRSDDFSCCINFVERSHGQLYR